MVFTWLLEMGFTLSCSSSKCSYPLCIPPNTSLKFLQRWSWPLWLDGTPTQLRQFWGYPGYLSRYFIWLSYGVWITDCWEPGDSFTSKLQPETALSVRQVSLLCSPLLTPNNQCGGSPVIAERDGRRGGPRRALTAICSVHAQPSSSNTWSSSTPAAPHSSV